MAALLADGWSVSEPTVPEAHDLKAEKDGITVKIQVKTIKLRVKDGVPYYVIRGLKNSGQVYDKYDCDAFVGVYDGQVYYVENSELSEYWTKADEPKWRMLPIKIQNAEAV